MQRPLSFSRPESQIGVEKLLDVAVQHAVKVGFAIAGPRILDPLVRRRKRITAVACPLSFRERAVQAVGLKLPSPPAPLPLRRPAET